ncbi:MAG: (NiFe) hydrogenase maturation protein HypF [Ignavibacteria bacterium]|nr:(NiFe) hydrogenase maturation protein HypF [Ignavibacteria bacterium]
MIVHININIRGAVQGVGFRPFIYKVANEMGLTGFVLNNSMGVSIEAEGKKPLLEIFLTRINSEKPSLSFIASLEYSFHDSIGYTQFVIKESAHSGEPSAIIMPDIALCPDCLHEMNNPSDRRYQYPFINCTNCGPRFTIIEALPYDRQNTTMKKFEMCSDCRSEYENPSDRRYHAQPIACPECGPYLELWNEKGDIISSGWNALIGSCKAILEGQIIALKGIGGFQLIVDARNTSAVRRLRTRKRREEKPFALMFPDFKSVLEICEVNRLEENLLNSPESPIVLLRRKSNSKHIISSDVAPDNPYIGAMLPYSPLHHLLMQQLQIPIIATSGNLAEEPICIEEYEALERLSGIAELYLTHNRPIKRHMDDSIVRVIHGRKAILRRARGFAPLPLSLENNPDSVFSGNMAVGADLKNTVAFCKGNNIFISQHIGDLSTKQSNDAFESVINDFKKLYKIEPNLLLSDLHPDYHSSRFAQKSNYPTKYVQHHAAHVLSCRFENKVEGEALGIAWDGTGYGTDGTIWGGEFFISDDSCIKHVAQMKQFPLPGGDSAIKEPRRSALGILYEIFGNSLFNNDTRFTRNILKEFDEMELSLLKKMLENKVNTIFTSSVGRMFDAVASIIKIKQKSCFEGQAAMALEFASNKYEKGSYDYSLIFGKKVIIDWENTIIDLITDFVKETLIDVIGGRFHNTLANMILSVTEYFNQNKVLLSGGCFQNALLTGKVIGILEKIGCKVYTHQLVPTNDGGISLGQIVATKYEMLFNV